MDIGVSVTRAISLIEYLSIFDERIFPSLSFE